MSFFGSCSPRLSAINTFIYRHTYTDASIYKIHTPSKCLQVRFLKDERMHVAWILPRQKGCEWERKTWKMYPKRVIRTHEMSESDAQRTKWMLRDTRCEPNGDMTRAILNLTLAPSFFIFFCTKCPPSVNIQDLCTSLSPHYYCLHQKSHNIKAFFKINHYCSTPPARQRKKVLNLKIHTWETVQIFRVHTTQKNIMKRQKEILCVCTIMYTRRDSWA